jgi:hypothetical protein
MRQPVKRVMPKSISAHMMSTFQTVTVAPG